MKAHSSKQPPVEAASDLRASRCLPTMVRRMRRQDDSRRICPLSLVLLASLIGVLTSSGGLGGPSPAHGGSGSVYFDDSDPELMVLGNSAYYEVAFRKTNGSIVYIMDKSTGADVSQGSRYQFLWAAAFAGGTPSFVGGAHYSAGAANDFTYAWSPLTQTLTLDYIPDSGASQQVAAQVAVAASEHPWLDLRLELDNDWGFSLTSVLFPHDLVFVEADIDQALLPIHPGVILEPAFFDENRSYSYYYPGWPPVFADYLSLDLTTGQFVMYSMHEERPFLSMRLGLFHDDAYVADSTFYSRMYELSVGDGETWTSPWVRVRVSQSHVEAAYAFRVDDHITQYPSLRDKLGGLYEPVVQSIVLKAYPYEIGIPFSAYPALLSQVPSPAIFHPIGYMPGGHDENYPDWLPPDPTWGTQQDFLNMVEDIQAMGFLVMPFISPVWWDDESPTVQSVDPGDIAVLDEQGNPVYECFTSMPDPPECIPENATRGSGMTGGYLVSPHVQFVQDRLHQAMLQMTEDVPSDLLFEDQLTTRGYLRDYNPAAPDPTHYVQGWLEHSRDYASSLLMCEGGFDRVVETEVGLITSILSLERSGATGAWFGADGWRAYPLTPMLARDRVLFYQHNLNQDTMTVDKATLTWNLAFGFMLTYDLNPWYAGVPSPWLRVAGDFQEHLVAPYADERVVGFADLAEDVTQTSFESFTVIANWDEVNPYDTGQHTLAPSGVVAESNDGTLTGGVFSSYNGVPLSAGDHYLIEERSPTYVTIRQPLGTDTTLTVVRLEGWTDEPIVARAYAEDGQMIGDVPVTVGVEDVTFTYQQDVGGQSAAYYVVTALADPVGGIAELPDVAVAATLAAEDSSGPSTGVIAGVAAGAAVVIALGAAWYARRRWVR